VCQVVGLVPGGDGTIVHLKLLPGLVDDYRAPVERAIASQPLWPALPSVPGMPSVWAGVGWKRRSRRLLVTTNTELKAIAAAAMRGLRKPSAASGIAAVL
jgi:hypothetical protein